MDKIINKDDPNGIIEGAVCELIFEVSDDLGIGLQAADDIVRATELYAALANECVLRDDYDLDGLKLILRKELVRSGKYPTVEEKPIRDFSDFVKTMKHEIVYNISMCNKLKLSLTQISLLVENIENLTINEGDSELVHDIYKLICIFRCGGAAVPEIWKPPVRNWKPLLKSSTHSSSFLIHIIHALKCLSKDQCFQY